MRVIERAEGRYETKEVPFGKVYAWRPGRVVIECSCGEVVSLIGSMTVCDRCGVDHASTIGLELDTRRLKDEELHPWRYVRDREDAGLPC